jgi:hypothetical protein
VFKLDTSFLERENHMNKAYKHLIATAPTLAEFKDNANPERLVARLGVASSGEGVMTAAALSFIPRDWLPVPARDVCFRLDDTGALDANNLRALIEAVAIQAGHIEVLP